MDENQAQVPLDEWVEVIISKDQMKAYIKLIIDHDDISVSHDSLLKYVSAHGIQHGVLYDKIKEISLDPVSFAGQEVLIAEGTDSRDGQDAKLEYMYQIKEEKKPKIREDGTVDFYSIQELANVKKGKLLAKKIPPTKGISGTNIFGEEVPGKDGKDIHIKPGKNTVIDKENGLVYAAIDGQVSVSEDGKIHVFPVYEVNGDVDFGVGNIDFVGTVVVRGKVNPGFSIKASGDIKVYGLVESAFLDCEGDIEISSGIIGHHLGEVKAGGNVKVSHIHSGIVSAKNDVIVSQSIMHSTIRAGGSVICQGSKGLIVGGTIQAGKKVKARSIGNEMATRTSIEVGVAPDLRDELKELLKEQKKLTENKIKTEKALQYFNQLLATTGNIPPDKKELQIKLANTMLLTEKREKVVKRRIKEIENMLFDIDDCSIEATHTIYPGVRLVFGSQIRYIKDKEPNCKFVLKDGNITKS
ncbi:FapA family protein [Microaerobacter geothermalis]|uniref:DUF342 domain-containing protein n=1 Tax=Microaerobacter geothermalis TaxID=674972 RepID=UPI001F16570A|nr:FapA family protein [Microaerobacter geothermalis]MCF6093810.1 FapA family protein [Microaerobacter geothermalis]